MKTFAACKIVALAAGLTLGTAAHAQDNSMSTGGADQAIVSQLNKLSQSVDETTSDKLFVLHAASGNLFEVELSKVVASKTQDAKVKAVAEQMITEHGEANQLLMPIAQDLGLTLPTDLPAMKKAELAVYSAMPADKLDIAYLSAQKGLHAKNVTDFADHANLAKNAKVKAYAAAMLPKLEAHTQHIVKVAQAKGVSGDLTAGSTGSAGSGTSGGTSAGDRTRTGNAPGPLPTPEHDRLPNRPAAPGTSGGQR